MAKNIVIGIIVAAVLGFGAWFYITQIDSTPIGKILANPRDYDQKVLTISGEVTDRVSLVFVKFFKLKDKTGEMIVITDRSLPTVGSKERVKGVVNEAFAVGNEQMLVFVEATAKK